MSLTMSDNEMRCYQAAMRWQRRELLRDLWRSLKPVPPMAKRFLTKGFVCGMVYCFLLVVFSPLLLAFWLLRSVFHLLLFPHRYLRASIKPRGLVGPGERNLQGVHNAFARYLYLSADSYVWCFNDWVGILYGEDCARKYRLENFLNLTPFERESSKLIGVPDEQLRYSLSVAREVISRELGYY